MSWDLRNPCLTKFSVEWHVINVTLLTLKIAVHIYKAIRIFSNCINEIILAFSACAIRSHQLQTSVRFISTRQCYVCYILNGIADNDYIEYI